MKTLLILTGKKGVRGQCKPCVLPHSLAGELLHSVSLSAAAGGRKLYCSRTHNKNSRLRLYLSAMLISRNSTINYLQCFPKHRTHVMK